MGQGFQKYFFIVMVAMVIKQGFWLADTEQTELSNYKSYAFDIGHVF